MRLALLNHRMTETALHLRNRHFLLLDMVLLPFLSILALALRMDDGLNGDYFPSLAVYTAVSLALWIGVLMVARVYSLNWQYASVEEVFVLVQAVAIGATLNVLVFFLILRPTGLVAEGFPRSIPLIASLLTLIALGATRGGVRWLHRRQRYHRAAAASGERVAVYGAGEAGLLIVRELLMNPQLGMTPVAFFDDDTRKHKTVMQGIRVVGGRDALARMARGGELDRVIIAMPSAPGKTLRDITQQLLEFRVRVQIVPGIYEMLNGTVTVNKLRSVEIEDLLRREPIATESAEVAALLRGKRVLVTGAGGSIGGELCRQIARCAPAQLVLLGHGENSIFMQGNELAPGFPQVEICAVIADVRDAPRMNAVMARFEPQLVFHAAAHKHVALMEHNLEDAVTNNVLGTRVTLSAAEAHGVETFVLISTDKAVNPESVMGATKRVAELYVHARALETGRRYVAVRFGNVLGSRGSVVPLFRQQIANGGPVQVTHPEVRRFFMTIPEAVHLVLQAATLGCGGEIFALDMGEPIKIVDLAQDLVRLSGLQVGRDIDIEFIGLRPGEKLFEELFVPGELYERTTREKIFVARNGVQPPPEEHAQLYAAVDDLIAAAQTGQVELARKRLQVIAHGFAAGSVAAGEAGR